MSEIFGGSKSSQSSTSSNKAYDYIRDAYGGTVDAGNSAVNSISSLLGVGGQAIDPATDPGFQNYLNSSGYQFRLNEGMRGLTANNATKGLLNSGSTIRGASELNQNLASGEFNNYLNQLNSLSQTGIAAGGLIGSTGQESTSSGSSKSTGGLAAFF